jgi:hypothetical protein
MDKKELQERLKKYAIAVVKFSEELPDYSGFRTVKNQIVRLPLVQLLVTEPPAELSQQLILLVKWGQSKKN